MRGSWPDASEARSTFEGRVLSRGAAQVDFDVPAPQRARVAETDESLLFVAPGMSLDGLEYDVDLDTDGVGLAPLPRAPERVARDATPGAHWRFPPPQLSEASRSARAPSGAWDDEEPTLPVIPLARRRSVLDLAQDAGDSLLGVTSAARAVRLGLAMSALFGVLALRALGDTPPTLDALTQMGGPRVEAHTPARLAAARAAKQVASPTRLALRVAAPATPESVVLPSAAPVWITAPRHSGRPRSPDAAGPRAASRVKVHALGLPLAPPLPRTEVARL